MGNMSMNPAMATSNSNPYNMFMGMQPAPQQQQQQQQQQPHTNTLSTNLWQWAVRSDDSSSIQDQRVKEEKNTKGLPPLGFVFEFCSLSVSPKSDRICHSL